MPLIFQSYKSKLLLLILFHIVCYLIFRHLNVAYQTWDSAGHMSLSIKFTEMFLDFIVGGDVSLYSIITESNYYPPLVHLIVGVLNIVFGYNSFFQLFFIFLIFLCTLVALYYLILLVGFEEKIAFYTVFFYSLFPIIADQSRLFHLEHPMILTILLSLIFLKKSENFTKFWPVIFFYISFSAGQLIKWYSFLYLVVPVLFLLYKAFIVDKRYILILRNIVIGSVIFSLIAFPWYLINFNDIRLFSSLFSSGELDDPKIMFSFENIFFYFRSILVYHTYFVPFLFSLTGGIWFFLRYKSPLKNLLLVQILLIYVIFTFIENKNSRYVIGIDLALAFFISYLYTKISNLNLKKIIVSIALFIFLFSSFNTLTSNTSEARAWGVLMSGPFYEFYNLAPATYSYRPYRPDLSLIYSKVLEDSKGTYLRDIGIMPLIDSEDIATSTLELYRAQNRFENIYLAPPYYVFRLFESDFEIIKFMRDKGVNYILVPDYIGPEGLRNYKALNQTKDFIINRGSDWFEKIDTFNYLNNSITIYKMKSLGLDLQINECKTSSEQTLSLVVEPLSTINVYTPTMEFNNISFTYIPDTLQIIRILNTSEQPQRIDIYKLPDAGYTYCQILGTKPKSYEEVSDAILFNEDSCGDSVCKSVKEAIFPNISSTNPSIKDYDLRSFYKNPIDKALKNLRFLPLYEKEYDIREEILLEND